MAYNSLDPMKPFPNWIFCPKIVPLVYDDSLSYYELLNKLLKRLNQVIDFANSLNLNVESLKTQVEELTTLISGFDSRISVNEEEIATLKNTTIPAINAAIGSINSALDRANARIDDVNSRFDDLEDEITSIVTNQIQPIEDGLSNLNSVVEALENRVANLEGAQFEGITVAPSPFNFGMDVRNGHLKGIEIRTVEDDTLVTPENQDTIGAGIKWLSAGRFTMSGTEALNTNFLVPAPQRSGTACYIKIPSVVPYRYSLFRNANPTVYIYSQRYIGTSSSTSPYLNVTTTLTDLIAGYTRETVELGVFNDVRLVLNQNTGCYDLRLYNGLNDRYVGSNDYRWLSFIFTSSPVFASGDSSATKEQKYFIALNSFVNQLQPLINVSAEEVIEQAETYTDQAIEAESAEIKSEVQERYDFAVGLSVPSIQPLTDEDLDYAFTPANSEVIVWGNDSRPDSVIGANMYEEREESGGVIIVRDWVLADMIKLNVDFRISGISATPGQDAIVGTLDPQVLARAALDCYEGQVDGWSDTEGLRHPTQTAFVGTAQLVAQPYSDNGMRAAINPNGTLSINYTGTARDTMSARFIGSVYIKANM